MCIRDRSHNAFRPLAVRRGHPNDKPRTERSFWEVERSFLNGREFRELDDMREQLARWLDQIVDHRRLEKRTALERFAEEREHLVTLPLSLIHISQFRHNSRNLRIRGATISSVVSSPEPKFSTVTPDLEALRTWLNDMIASPSAAL